MNIKNIYEIQFDDDLLDMQAATAIGVAVEAFMNR